MPWYDKKRGNVGPRPLQAPGYSPGGPSLQQQILGTIGKKAASSALTALAPQLGPLAFLLANAGTPNVPGPYVVNVADPVPNYNRGSINIKPENKGKFTAKANAAGMGVQEYASKVLSAPEGRYDPSTRKQANFARNASKWDMGTVRVPGYNIGEDTVPAMLTPGEAVIPAEAAQNPKNQPVIEDMIAEGRMMQDMGEPMMDFGPDPLANFGYIPSKPMGSKDQMEMDKVDIQRAKAEQDMMHKDMQMMMNEKRKEESHQQSMMNKQEVHAERKGPLGG